MAMFLAEISFLLALALVAAGLVLWQRGRETTAGLLRTAGAVLVVGAALTALCTGYFSVRYHVQGEFDRAYAHPAAMAAHGRMDPTCPHQGPHGMAPGMMAPGRMGGGMMQPGTQAMPMPGEPSVEGTEPPDAPPGHEEHHPEGGE